jgi:hypothetical protein
MDCGCLEDLEMGRISKTSMAIDRNSPSSGSCGFALLEAMAILVLLSVGVVAAGGLHTRAVMVNAAARRSTHASFLAAAQMEKLMVLPYDAPTLRDRTGDGIAGLWAARPASADGCDLSCPPYVLCWNVAQVPTFFDPTTINYKRMAVMVAWKERGMPRRLSLSGYRSHP